MEIRNLVSFVQVAEYNSFTKAAKILGYSQSTISFQIKQLEEELDCLLFERVNHTISLTEKGREITNKINDLVDQVLFHVSGQIPQERLAVFYETLYEICENLKSAEDML